MRHIRIGHFAMLFVFMLCASAFCEDWPSDLPVNPAEGEEALRNNYTYRYCNNQWIRIGKKSDDDGYPGSGGRKKTTDDPPFMMCLDCQNKTNDEAHTLILPVNSTTCESDVASESMSEGCSIIDGFSFNHIHGAYDYKPTRSMQSGCSSCGIGLGTVSTPKPTLQLARYCRFRDITEPSSFGPGIFSSFDISLSIMHDGATNRVRYFDPRMFFPFILEDTGTKDGIFQDNLSNGIKELRLLDGANGTGNLVTDIYQAKSAVLNGYNGNRYTFDVISLDAPKDAPLPGA
jgi:hypothetical protein